ncbi:MAG: DUF2336 domain-containing protein [Caulobacteraceae bacterium]
MSDADIRLLVKGTEPEERAMVAHRLCRHIDRAELTDEEREEAHKILRLMAHDNRRAVRRALAVTLKASPLVPRDVANRLARDIESIAVPLLNFSPVFSDDDLAEIVRIGGPVRQRLSPQRPVLTEKVTDAIAEHAESEAVRTATANSGARFSEHGLQTAIDRFEASEDGAGVDRPAQRPAGLGQRAADDAVTGELREQLISGHGATPQTALALAIGTRERASPRPGRAGPTRASDLPRLRGAPAPRHRLTASLLLRALAFGHMSFFEWGLADLSGVPHHRNLADGPRRRRAWPAGDL